jgi:aminomethyltransferase
MSLTDELAAIENGLGAMAVPAGDLLHLGGAEPLAALDRVVSQEVRSLRDGQGRLALLLAPKGQFRALMTVLRIGGEAHLLAPAGRGSEVAALLAGYLRFSRVAVAPAGWDGGAWRVVGPRWTEVAARVGVDAGSASSGCAVAGEPGDRLLLVGQTFAGVPGVTAVAESATALRRLDDTLRRHAAVDLSEDTIEAARVVAGLPAWGRELTESVLPPEVGIETVAISYTKGCYVGQETIARMRTYGRPNWRLARLRQIDGPLDPPPLPCDLFFAGDEKARGRLTSWAQHPRHGAVALALVHRSVGDDPVLEGGDRRFALHPHRE